MSRKRSSTGSPAPYLVVALLVVAAVGFGYWLVRKPAPPPEVTPPPPKPLTYPGAKERRQIKIYVVKMVDDEPRLAPEERAVARDAEPHTAALERLIATNREAGPSQYLIPMGTKLIGLQIRNRIAYPNFSREIKENFPGGSLNEALLLNAIAHTLTQFGDVDKVQVLIEGKRVETLGGHLDISEPVAGDSTLIGQGEAE